jgi:hypothetical protein
MSAEDTGNAPSQESVDTGPVEIFVGTTPPVVETNAPKPDVTDVEVKAPKSTDSDDSDKGDQPDESRATKPRVNGVQDRIDELTRARRAAEREAEYWKARAADTSVQNPAPPADVKKPPVRADFDSDEAYEDARIDYRADQRLAERESQNAAKVQLEASEREAAKRATDYQARLSEARSKISDFDDVVNGATATVAPHVVNLLVDHDNAGELMYHFAKNPQDLEQLNELSAPKAALKMAEIALNYNSPAVKPAAVEKPTTKAPAPIRPIGQSRSTATPLEEQSMEDYVKTRKAQGASWAR